MERKNAWNEYSAKDLRALEDLCEEYKGFLSNGKTERLCTELAVEMAKKAGYHDLKEIIGNGKKLKAGDKVYAVNMEKALVLFNIGTEPLEQGMNILGAHIDTCRLDVKQNPLYEDGGLAYMDTNYYGGIKKYQWVTIPLAIHGVVCTKNNKVIEVNIGEEDSDPVFCITDLLIHLSAENMDKKAAKVIEGEALDILIGSRPLSEGKKDEKEKEAVKNNVLKLLEEKYGIDEEDFISAELEIVPAGPAKDCGIDKSMIMGYGQDDRICAFTSLKAMLNVDKTDYTTCCLLVDKEEIGSVGATGMQSRFFENIIAELLGYTERYDELKLRRCLTNSRMLSSDVSAAFDPLYASAYEKKNAAYFGKGVVFNKYTGSRGKSGSNDANAEYIARIRKVLDDANVAYQTAELGKVDVGGGGTIAYIMALYGMEVIDCGVAVLNMHAPWEIVSKADIYEAVKCYEAFLKEIM